MTIRAIVDKWPVADRIKQAFLEWLPEEGFVLDEEPGPGFSQLKLEELRPPFSLSDAKDILSQLATALTCLRQTPITSAVKAIFCMSIRVAFEAN